MSFAHLIPEAARLLDSPAATRFSFIESDKVIETPVFNLIQARLHELYAHPRVLRPPNLAIVGPSGVGKSHALSDFAERYPPRRAQDRRLKVPVLHIEYPPEPDNDWLVATLAKGLGHKIGLHRKKSAAFAQLLDWLEEAATRLIIIEEVNQLYDWGGQHHREFYGVTRWLSNQSQVPIVLSGTDEVLQLIDGDVQLVRRFERLQLASFALNDEFAGFLKGYLCTLPLRNETLLDRSFIERVHEAGQGLVDTTVKVLQRAAKRAILDGADCISLDHICADADLPPPVGGPRQVVRRRRRRGGSAP